MRIAVCSAYEMAGVIAAWQPDAIISALSPKVVRGEADPKHLRLAFHDVEQAKHDHRFGARPSDIAAVITMVRDRRPERLLITCLVGLSRSPALAIIAAVTDGHRIETACRAVHAAVPHASPNRWVLKLGGRALDIGDALATCVMETFTYRRTLFGPIGPKTRFVEIPLDVDLKGEWL